MGSLWAAEPVLLSMLGSGALWGAVTQVLAAFGHPLTPAQAEAVGGLLVLLGSFVARSQVHAPDTLAAMTNIRPDPPPQP